MTLKHSLEKELSKSFVFEKQEIKKMKNVKMEQEWNTYDSTVSP